MGVSSSSVRGRSKFPEGSNATETANSGLRRECEQVREEKMEIEMGLQGLLEIGKENEYLGEMGREGNRVMVAAAMRRWEGYVF